ncbi:MAG: hypothetical protein EPN69_07345 [Rhodanobacter sp.]|nr:MAG: hypothetical protein EPN69_07345 [Rhodanobacter sp.]TAL97707.1 MAG: hypothetical protein EPN71_08680 [Rhodanobacter sp.]TAM39905.1 MAG: hypothetical protein EPN58_12380 [Rhodanobacter sp.]TAN27501.1 MAG: hypothetical protein EPN32_04495 [Rhodanobacter sp.]
MVSPTGIGVFATAGQAEHVDEDASSQRGRLLPKGCRAEGIAASARARLARWRGGQIPTISAEPAYVGQVRTTSRPGGHALSALPQNASVNINCRIFPGTSLGSARHLSIERTHHPTGVASEYTRIDPFHLATRQPSEKSNGPSPRTR